MAGKRKPVIYKDKDLYANGGNVIIRVRYDKKNDNYALCKKVKGQKDELIIINKSGDNAKAKIAVEFYKLTEKTNVVQIEQHHVQPQVKHELKITWLYIFEKDKKIQDYLFKFYDEEHFVQVEEGENPITIDDILEKNYDCQAAFKWDQILQAREHIRKVDKNHEPMIWNCDGEECFIIYNCKEPKENILHHICNTLNHMTRFINIKNKKELKDGLFDAGVVTKDRLKEGKEHWGDDVSVISEKDLEGFYKNTIYKTEGTNMSIVQNTLDKEFIVKQFAKFFKENQHSTAILAEMPELLNTPEEQNKKT